MTALVRTTTKFLALGHPMYAPPAVPSARVAAPRKAFDAIVQAPEFLAAAKNAKADIRPMSGADLRVFVGDILKNPLDVIARMREILGIKE